MNETIDPKRLLSSGSTLLNLACSGQARGGFLKGKYVFIVGDSASGKTFLSMTCMAEATINKHFKDYRLIYDNVEDGLLLDIDGLFSPELAKRVEPPATQNGEPVFSDTLESFYFHLDDLLKEGKPFIYVLDSMDALDSEPDRKKFEQHKAVYRRRRGEDDAKPEKVAGSYGDGKAKANSQGLRRVLNGLRDTGSILIIISQTRDNIGSTYGGKTRAGGHSLRFYATIEFWSSIITTIKKTVQGRDREIGVRVRLAVKKNRITGQRNSVEVDIYPQIGIDDVGSCIDYLIEEGFWIKSKQTITATGLNISGTKEKLIKLIEADNLEPALRQLCQECWDQVEAACSLKRKKRYDTTGT